MTESPFSKENPKLQIVWDSTSLGELQKCPRRYEYSILGGYRSSGTDVEFGRNFAKATEVYRKGRLAGDDKTTATIAALDRVARDTWDPETGPWGGVYETQWRCTGTEPFRNGKGNRAKCPWSHAGVWAPGHAPGDTCGTCGSHTHEERRWVSNNHVKDRVTLIRLIAWYCDDQPEDMLSGGIVPYAFPNGTPAVELSFKLPTPWRSPAGETYILAGHLDSIVTAGGDHYVDDNKTTKKTLSEMYWSSFTPNTQVDLYDLAASLLYPDLPIRGVIIEGAQTLVGGANFGMRIFRHNEAQREEYFAELEWWIRQAERYAEEGYWPMNRSACTICPFKKICSMDPSKRKQFLDAEFEVKHWNPLDER